MLKKSFARYIHVFLIGYTYPNIHLQITQYSSHWLSPFLIWGCKFSPIYKYAWTCINICPYCTIDWPEWSSLGQLWIYLQLPRLMVLKKNRYLPMYHSIFFIVDLDELSKSARIIIVDCFGISKGLKKWNKMLHVCSSIIFNLILYKVVHDTV